mgnify:CR=1 FL=1
MSRIFLVAGEASGDALGAGLIAGLRRNDPGLDIAGIGGPAMAGEGLTSLFPMSELSVMGLAEVLPRLPSLMARRSQTVRAAHAFAPDALITIDSPDFGLRVADGLRRVAPWVRRIHYVAPTVWAWRPGRAAKLAKRIDHLLALYPFEPAWFTPHGLTCDFVGHPAATATVASEAEVAQFRAAEGLGEAPMLLILPGSRSGEVARLGPRFGAALARLAAVRPGLGACVVAAPGVAGAVRKSVAAWPVPAGIIDLPERADAREAAKRQAFAAADVALAASGTVSLELARQGTAMVIGYDTSRPTRLIAKRLLTLDTVTLVNILTGRRDVPEYLGAACTPDALAGALERLLSDPSARAAQTRAGAEAMALLGAGGAPPGERAARSVLAALAENEHFSS